MIPNQEDFIILYHISNVYRKLPWLTVKDGQYSGNFLSSLQAVKSESQDLGRIEFHSLVTECSDIY